MSSGEGIIFEPTDDLPVDKPKPINPVIDMFADEDIPEEVSRLFLGLIHSNSGIDAGCNRGHDGRFEPLDERFVRIFCLRQHTFSDNWDDHEGYYRKSVFR